MNNTGPTFAVHDSLSEIELEKLIRTLEGTNAMHHAFIEQNTAAIAAARTRMAELQQVRAGTDH